MEELKSRVMAGLRACSNNCRDGCKPCPYFPAHDTDCLDKLHADAVKLIWPENAGQRWNARESESASVITTQEILSFRADMTDERGACACWLETIEGDITAICLSVSASDEGREVYENGYGDFWERDRIDAEGIRWRLWDKRPTMSDREREPWGQVGFQVMSDAARAEAERIRAELAQKQRERQRQRAEADRHQMEKLEEAAAQAGEL